MSNTAIIAQLINPLINLFWQKFEREHFQDYPIPVES